MQSREMGCPLSLHAAETDQRTQRGKSRKKYAKLVTPLKSHLHKLRSTYGAKPLPGNRRDIPPVASVLGHNDVNTTRKHYAAQGGRTQTVCAECCKAARRLTSLYYVTYLSKNLNFVQK